MQFRRLSGVLLVAGMGLAAAPALAQQGSGGPPPWAYGFTTPAPATANVPVRTPVVERDNVKKFTVPGSSQSFTEAEAQARYAPADWFPEDHGPMPEIVKHGRESAKAPIYACGLCHLTNGRGRSENANVTGLPYDYFVQQIMDFRNGLRKTSDPRKTNPALMAEFTREMTDAEIRDAAIYFGSIKPAAWIKVVETPTVAKTRVNGGILFPIEGAEAGTEAIGNRIIEVPSDPELTEKWRYPRGTFIAYVPPGSIKKGEALVTTGDNGRFTPCTVCHGPDLNGQGPIPRLTGRAASYTVRQLYDFQHGNRAGAWSSLMAPVVAKLTEDDLVNITAYVTSLTPQ